MRYESDSEISRLEAFVQELKNSIEELMEVKNRLLGENRRFLAILKKKEQSDRQRKQLLLTEFKEIDRIEKVIDRLQWWCRICIEIILFLFNLYLYLK